MIKKELIQIAKVFHQAKINYALVGGSCRNGSKLKDFRVANGATLRLPACDFYW